MRITGEKSNGKRNSHKVHHVGVVLLSATGRLIFRGCQAKVLLLSWKIASHHQRIFAFHCLLCALGKQCCQSIRNTHAHTHTHTHTHSQMKKKVTRNVSDAESDRVKSRILHNTEPRGLYTSVSRLLVRLQKRI
jgi:hypothetical protein